jgi:SAM-dependent methyltransferase
MEEVLVCPVCSSASFRHYLDCIDYALTKEAFTLRQCTSCNLVVTSPRPVEQNLGSYYQFPSYISHSGKSQSGLISLIYKSARYLALRRKGKLIEQRCAVGRILDIGCGTGEFLHYMKSKGLLVTGVEPSTEARTKAEQLLGQKIYPSADQLPPVSFEVITLWHALEHIPNLQVIIQQIRQLLKPNGLLVLAVPNHEAYDAGYYGSYWAAYDVPRHLWHFTSGSMVTLLKKNYLTPLTILPMKLDAYYVSLLSEQYRHPKQRIRNLFRAAFTGVLSNLKARNKTNYSSLIFLAKANSK